MPSPIPTNNSGVSQVLLNGEEIMTTMGDTVSPDNLLEGETATDKSGGKIEGAIDPVEQGDFDLLEQDVEELKSQTYNILDEEGEITDDDFVPFQDVSDSAKPKKKVTFGTILEKFKGLYAFISGSNIKDPDTFRSNIKTIDQLGTNIPDDANLDDYKTAGTYRVVSDASGASITNLPLALCGKVVVFANGNGGFEQFYFPNHSPRVFARTIFGDESWSDWREFGDTNFWALKGGTKIPQNADLNTYTTVGNYYIALDADAQTISNRPVSTAGRLFVIESFDSSNYKIQLYYQRAIAMGVWQRSTSNNGSTWGDWVCNYTTTSGNPINTLVVNSRIGNRWSQLKHRIGADKRLALNFSTDNGSTWDGDKVLALLSDCITQTGTAIPSNSNLNAYQTGGNYYVLDSTTASTISNVPVASAGKLLVIKRDTGARLFQIYMAGEKAIYIRSMDNSINFTNWISLANSANSYNILGTASEIPANSDLDTYTTAGTYDCFTASNAQSLSNCPVGLAFKLLVDVEHNPAVVTQTITLLNSNSQMPFRRSKENTGSWGAWKQYASLADVSAVNEKFSVAGNMINDFNDVSFFQSFFVANSSRILPFKSATANQPAIPASWGFCIIYFGGSNANFSLFYVNVENYVYTRGYINGAWRDWELISHKTHHLYQVDNAHQITANQDLNDYTTAGTYKCGNASIATTLTNCPVNVSFKLVVDRAYVDTKSEITQRITCMNSADYPEYYRTRQYNASSWGAWKSLVIAKASTVDNVKKIEMVTRSADGTWADFVFNDSDNHIKQKFHNGTSWGTEETLANMTDIIPSTIGDGYAVGTVSGSAITATITGFKLKAGVIVAIKIDSGMTSACTLNINNTGAKYIKFWSDDDPSYGKGVGKSQVTTFMYDGTYYRVLAFDRAPSVGMSGYSADTSGTIMLDWGYGVNRAQLKYDIPNNRLRWNYYKNSAWRGDVDVLDYDRICKNLSNISSLDDIPLNSFGVVAFATNSGLEPISGLNSYHYECTGYGNGGKKVTLTRYNSGFNDSQAKWERVRNDVGWTSYWVDYTPRGTYVGTCTTAGDTKDKVATVESGFKLITGVRVAIKFTNTNTYNSQSSSPVTLNVNGTGAKNIWINTNHTGGANFGTTNEYLGCANRYIYYIYDGTYWVWDGTTVDSNSTSYLPNNASGIVTASQAYIMLCNSNIDITKANNDVSSTQYPAFIVADKNRNTMGRMEVIVESGGLISNRLFVLNKNSNGTNATNGIYIRMDKNLNGSYKVENNDKFNLALGFAIASDSRTSASATITASASYYTLGSNAIVWVNFNYDVPASSTLNINSCGARNINYRGASILANVIKAGDRAIFFYNGSYNLFCIDREAVERTFTATLSANATSVTFTGLPTSGNYIYDIFTSKAGLCYNSINDSTSGQITVTFDAQSSAVTVYLKVRNA